MQEMSNGYQNSAYEYKIYRNNNITRTEGRRIPTNFDNFCYFTEIAIISIT